jgi:hypothetical protein
MMPYLTGGEEMTPLSLNNYAFFTDCMNEKIFYVFFFRHIYNILIFLASSIAPSSLSFAFNFKIVALVLSLYPQQGQNNPFHFINRSQTLQRLCPVA